MAHKQAAALRPGDWIVHDDGDHQVVALAGTSVRLRSSGGAESETDAAAQSPASVVSFGVFDAHAEAERWL
ncbi:hypothetical protein AB0I66_20270 [Streptomyces sp. NPDC050439]|uniref:hypothetical protein n=1 Tax=unclassified Streptomyces TaxID=2593676 RepID=UPI003435CC1F